MKNHMESIKLLAKELIWNRNETNTILSPFFIQVSELCQDETSLSSSATKLEAEGCAMAGAQL